MHRNKVNNQLIKFLAGTLPFPRQIKPPNNDQTCKIGKDVSFEWSPVSGASSYTLQIWSCQQSCSDPNSWTDLRPISPVTVGANTRHSLKFPKRGEYWWRVWANEGTTQGRKSDWFTIKCQQ